MAYLLAQFNSFTSVLNNLYITDVFDVFIISLFIYTAIFLFKQTRSTYVATGVGIIVALYLLAKTFGLFLTSLVFRAFFGVFFIALVVIFQEELRSFFEYLAKWSTRHTKRSVTVKTTPLIKEIINAIWQLSREKTGAIIVIKGTDSLSSYVKGGKQIDAIVTEELLLSIFDTSSPGHDGAITIADNRISIFGGHLPLSHDFTQIDKKGTRHAAALGLAELTDSFIIVVSEEKGMVSYALDRKLITLNSADELVLPLNNYLKEKYPEQTFTILENLVKKNSLEKIASIMLASIFWFLFSFQATTIQRNFVVPIILKNSGSDILLEDIKPNEVNVALTARGATAFDILDVNKLAISLDVLSLATGTQKISIVNDMVSHPSNFTVVNIMPREFSANVIKVKLIDIKITPNISGKPASGFEISKITSIPDTIKAVVPESFDVSSSLNTDTINISGSRITFSTTTKIIVPKNVLLKDKSGNSVEVQIEIRKK